MDGLECIRRGYNALGFGADRDVLAMFDQLGREPARWVMRDTVPPGFQVTPCGDIVAMDLFGHLPPQYEVIGVSPEKWEYSERHACLVVSGHVRVRPRGGWDVVVLPFVHIWSFAEGRVQKVVSFLEGVEVMRLAS